MPLHAVWRAVLISTALLICGSLYGQQPVPLIGLSQQSEVPFNTGCTPTGQTIRGSTHQFTWFREEWRTTGTVPDLLEVQCQRPPVEITSRSVESDPVGNLAAFHIQFRLRANTEGVGRVDLGGVGSFCYKTFAGLAWYKYQVEPGDRFDGAFAMQCFSLGNKHWSTEQVLEWMRKGAEEATVCRVVLLDKRGMKGQYLHTWFNHDEPVCQNMRAIDPAYFCRDQLGYSHSIPANDICDGPLPRKDT